MTWFYIISYDKIKNTREIAKGSLSDPENGYIEPGLPGNNVEGPEPMSYNTWVKSCCTTISYYMKNNGGGKARYSKMEKRPASYNQHFNTYSKQVDTLKSLEYGTLLVLLV